MSGDVLSIGCPDTHCDTEVTSEQIEAIVDADLFEKYKLFHHLAKMRLETDSRWCPKPDCNTIMKGDPETLSCKCTNINCGYEFCFNCSLEWHPGFTCEEIAKKTHLHKDTKRADKWKKKHKTKQCPQCRADIEKDKGCNHMTCASCQYQFCWLCMRKYTADHYNLDNFEGCPGRCFDIPKSVRRKRQIKNVAVATTTVSVAVVIGAVSLVLLIPVLLISVPIYGGYRAGKHFKKKK
jgi:E3 ubiquitin-protein ligase RNF19A